MRRFLTVIASKAKQSLARHMPCGKGHRFKRLPRRAEALLAMTGEICWIREDKPAWLARSAESAVFISPGCQAQEKMPIKVTER